MNRRLSRRFGRGVERLELRKLMAADVRLDNGVLRTTLDKVIGTINAANLKTAHAAIEGGRSTGKLVLEGW